MVVSVRVGWCGLVWVGVGWWVYEYGSEGVVSGGDGENEKPFVERGEG